MPGVIAVITHANAPAMTVPPKFDPQGDTHEAPAIGPILQTAEIFYNGQPIAIVVADTLDRAAHAASLVGVRYRELAATTSFEAAKATAIKPKNILGDDTEVEHGHAEAALAKASVSVDHVYRTPRYNHNSIEPHAATAVWTGDQLLTATRTRREMTVDR